jgi:NADPH:quinone reductase
VLIDVGAVGLNFPDLLLCAGRYQERPELPFCPGYEAAGVVAEAGEGSGFAAGDAVLVVPELPNGALQEMITVPTAQVYPVPATMPVTDAAVLHIAYQTAYVALHRRARLSPGEVLLVTGAAGGVGTAAVQLGRAAGARVVAAVTGPLKAAACRELGADEVIDLRAEPSPAARIRELTGGQGVDVVVDVVGGDAFDWIRRCVGFEGRVVVTGFTSGSFGAIPANHLLLRNYSAIGLHLAMYRRENPAVLREAHEALIGLYERGEVKPVIHSELPFEQAPAGLEMLAARGVIGRVALRC